MGFKLGGDWGKFTRFLNRRRRRRELQEGLRRQVQRQLHLLKNDIIAYIDAERHGVPNSPLTILVKGSSRPLVDRGDLRQSVNVRTEVRGDNVMGGVGVLRTKRSREGKKLWNIAVALHEGFTVKVTPAVRAAVFAEMRKRQGKKVKFTGTGGSKTWKVKGRPFVEDPFEAAVPRIKLALGDAVIVTLRKD
jgi:hypothetical protein